MAMTAYTLASISAAAFALATVCLLLPMAHLIPNWMESRVLREAANDAEQIREDDSFLRLPGYPAYVTATVGAALGFTAFAVHGASPEGIGLCIYFFSLLLLLTINVRHLLLPDVVVLPTLGTALLFRALGGDASSFIYGSIAGFAVPYLINFAIRLGTRKDILGYGDMKAFAMAGAWFGLVSLPILFVAFVLGGIAYAIFIMLVGRATGRSTPLPSGPAHLMASLAALLHPCV